MNRQTLFRLIAVSLLVPLWLAAPRFALAEPMAAIPNNHQTFTMPASPMAPDRKLYLTVVFKIRNRDEWDRTARELQNQRPTEPRHFWTPEESHQQFGPSLSDFRMVEQWLLSKGFTVVLERYGKGPWESILVTGSAAQVESAFGTGIVQAQNHLFWNTSDPVVPARIAAVIDHVAGLDNAGGGKAGPAVGPFLVPAPTATSLRTLKNPLGNMLFCAAAIV